MNLIGSKTVLIGVFALVIILVSSVHAETLTQKKLTWTGCGIAKKAFMAELAKAYERSYNISVALTGGGATKGIRSVAKKTQDMGGSCRFVFPNNEKEQGVRMEPVAWDALVVIVHPKNPVQNISLNQIRLIYTGKIRDWSALGGPKKPIKLYARKGKTSGIGRNLRELVFANFDQEITAPHAKFFKGSTPVERSVENDQWGVGVTGISSAKRRKVKLLDLENRKPSFDNIKAGTYILYYPLYLVINANEDRREVLNFLQFAHSNEGRAVLRDTGTVPYLDALHLVMKQINQKERARELGLFKSY